MRDMSYRDKMVILVISIVIIMIAGFFLLIKPAYNKLVTDTTTYEETKTEWDGIKAKLDAIPELKEAITKTYNDAKKDAAVLENTAFGDIDKEYSIKKVNFGLDQYLHQVIDDNSLAVSKMEIDDASDSEISYYVVAPNVITYGLMEKGDLNGNFAKELTELVETSTVLEERQTATVLGNEIKLSLTGKREDLMNFLETMKEDNNAINIDALEIRDYTFTGGTTREVTDAEGNVSVVANPNAEGTSELELTMKFYNAKELDKPDLGD